MARSDKYTDIIVGLDFGTTKICAVVGRRNPKNQIDIVGIGRHPSSGIRKGVVINIESTVESVRAAIEEAEMMAGIEIQHVFAGIAGGHIKGFNSHGMVAIKEGEVTKADMARVIDAAKAVAIPLDREVIHIIPQDYIIDDQDGIKDPLGMSGVRLEVKVHVVTGAVSSAQNIIKCATKTGLNVADIVLEPLASAEAVLTKEEKDLGVALIDIGGGTTDLAMFSGGSIVHSCVLAIGGNHVTNDVALGLRTAAQDAERLKIKYGCAKTSLVNPDQTLEVPGVGGRPSRIVPRKLLAQVIEPRIEEIYALVFQEMKKSGFHGLMASGIVMTGGSSLLPGMVELAEQVFGMPVKVGLPYQVGGLVDVVRNPIYSTGVGLVLYGAQHVKKQNRFKIREDKIYHKVRDRMKAWFGEIF
jgi:cell division protein FtsA